MRRAHLCLPLAAIVAFVALPAQAQQPDVQKQVEKLSRKAMEDYDAAEFESSRDTLVTAISKLRDAGLDETRTAAQVYINLGVVYIAGFKDKSRGVQQFVNALKIDGSVELDAERATPEVEEAFQQAKKQTGAGTVKRPPPKPQPTVPEVQGLQHNVIDEAPAGQDVAVRAQLGADVGANRLFLFYRGRGQEDYVAVPMVLTNAGDWVATIPAEAVEGTTVQYYLEARDNRGRALTNHGSAPSPNIITVKGGAKPAAPPEEVEDPLADRRGKGKGKGKKGDEPAGGDRGFGRLFLYAYIGTAGGLQPAGNKTEVAYLYQRRTDAMGNDISGYFPQPIGQTGFVFAPLHVSVELGGRINKRIAIGGYLRLGLTLLNNADSSLEPPLGGGTRKATNDIAGMLRFRYQFGDQKAHPFFHIGAGGGTIRHVLDITTAQTPERPLVDQTTADFYQLNPYDPNKPVVNEICRGQATCVDTIAVGYLLLAVGGGFSYDFTTWKNGGFGLIVDADVIFALPVAGQFGLNFDLQLGLGAHFL